MADSRLFENRKLSISHDDAKMGLWTQASWIFKLFFYVRRTWETRSALSWDCLCANKAIMRLHTSLCMKHSLHIDVRMLHTDINLSCVDLERPLLISNNRRLRIVARFCMLFRAKCNQNDSPRPTGSTFCVLRHNGEIIARDHSGTAMYAIRPVALLSIWGLRLS